MFEVIRIYKGVRHAPNGCSVTVNGSKLCLYLSHVTHSPTGFEWGYLGSGPRQLAYAILYSVTRDKILSINLGWNFAHQVVSRLPRDWWGLSSGWVRRWIRTHRQGNAVSPYLSVDPTHGQQIAAWAAGIGDARYAELVGLIDGRADDSILADWLEGDGAPREWVDHIGANAGDRCFPEGCVVA